MNATRTLATVRAAPRPAERGPAPAEPRDVTLIPGDGVGPEVMAAALHVLDAAGARVRWHYAEAGGRPFRRGVASGLPDDAAATARRTGVVLAGPMGLPPDAAGRTTAFPRMFDPHVHVLWVRPLPGAAAGVAAGRGVDLRVVRDAAGEARPADEPEGASRAGCRRLARAAFELALADGCPRVHCATRADLLLFPEEMMRRVFHETARAYPGVEAGHLRVDEVARLLVTEPERFGVIVATGGDGEALGAVAAGLVGGAATAPRARLGDGVAVFEPAHGPMHALAGRDAANPSAAILAGVEMLRHLGQMDVADAVEQALCLTLDAGVRTPDLPGDTPAVRTAVFAEAVVACLGRRMPGWAPRERSPLRIPALAS